MARVETDWKVKLTKVFRPADLLVSRNFGCVRISPVALWLGSEMDPYRRDLKDILHSYLVSDSFGPVLGARA